MREPEYLDQYRPNVGICLFNRHGQIWLGRRAGIAVQELAEKEPYVWQMPQGGVDPEEDVIDAAFRELYEETGVKSAQLIALSPGWLLYDFPAGYVGNKKRKWRGQRQKWAAMLFTGNDSEFDLNAHEEQEFESWRWATIEDTPELIIPFKRGVYEEVVRSFAPVAKFIQQSSGRG